MLTQEFRLASRSLRRAPAYGAATIATFALVVGAAVAIFTAVDAVLLRSLPYPDSDNLLFIGEREADGDMSVSSPYTLGLVASLATTLVDVSIFNITQATLTGAGEPTLLSGAAVTWNYFRTLRRDAALGRTFRPEEGVANGPNVVVISDRLWRSRFQSDPGIIGRAIDLSGTPFEVIGVMPPDFRSPDDYIFGDATPDIWGPAVYQGSSPSSRFLRAVARPAPGITRAQVDAELTAIGARIAENYPDWRDGQHRIVALPLQEHVTASVRPVLVLLAATALLVLFIGVANLTNLVFARGLGRRSEFEVRAALGARGFRPLRPLLAELVLAGIIGAALGLAGAMLAIDSLVAAAPASLPQFDAMGVGGRAMALAAALAILLALAASVLPLLRIRPSATGGRLGPTVRGSTGTRAHHRAQSAFAIAQMALALAVLAGATVLARSFLQLLAVDPGYSPEGVYAIRVGLPQSRYPDGDALRRFMGEVANRAESSPALASAGLVSSLPHHGLNNFSMGITVEGWPEDSERPYTFYRTVEGRYFETMGIPLLAGRGFEPSDFDGQPRNVIINQEFAQRFFPGGTGVGGRIRIDTLTLEVAGVVGSVRYGWLGAGTEPEMYVPFDAQTSTMFLVGRAAGSPESALAALRDAVQSLDPLLPLDVTYSSERLLADSTARPRFALLLLGTLAAIAVLLAALGLYGIMAHAVSERMREFGIRVALGAGRPDVLALLMRRGAAIAAAGALLGLALALAGGRLLEGLLFGTSPHDPLMLAAATLLLVLIALFASWWPARRAAQVDPMLTLRSET